MEGMGAAQPVKPEAWDVSAMEAILFASGDPISIDELMRVLAVDRLTVQNLLTELEEGLAKRHSGLSLRRLAGGFQLVTRPDLYPVVERLGDIVERRLSRPTMETLSIIAFKQPVTKTEIEQIRGVRIEKALARLLELELIEEIGRKETIGRPILYGTTATFLRSFGLDSLDELPTLPTNAEAMDALEPEQLALLSENMEAAAIEDEGKEISETDEDK